MLVQFGHLKGIIKVRDYTIDNVGFKLHYRLTMWMFLVATILVTSRQYIGEHIKCITDDGVAPHVIETFCFFTSTFTVPKYYNEDLLKKGFLPHPGIGPLANDDEDEVTHHAYYQWVPFVLFLQSIMFYIPHLIWKKKEGGRLRLLAEGLRLGVITEGNAIDCNGIHVTSRREKEEKIAYIRDAFADRRTIHASWCYGMIICEVLNLANVVLQAFVTDAFLGGKFWTLGPKVLGEGVRGNADILEEIFPKVTKCTFHKYGPSGSIQNHDAMCVMALNVINEKIYVFLWFWLVFLFACSALAVLYRFGSVALHSRSRRFNELVFAPPSKRPKSGWYGMVKRYTYADWLFLSYLSSNMDPLILRELFETLGRENGEVPGDPDEAKLADAMMFFDNQ